MNNPFQFALLYHNPELAQRMRSLRIETEAMYRETNACCVECHAPLIHAAAGIFYCPYERARMHSRARSILLGNSAGDRGCEGEASHPPSSRMPRLMRIDEYARARKLTVPMVKYRLQIGALQSFKVGAARLIRLEE